MLTLLRTHPLTPTRVRYVGKTFFVEGEGADFEKGEFVVERVSEHNNFMCRRVGGDEGEGEELFDMSYVIQLIREYEED